MSTSKTKRKIDDMQLNIFDYIKSISEQSSQPSSTEGKFRIINELRSSLSSAIKACPLSRHQIAGEMSHLSGEAITKEQIDSWTAESKVDRHIPAEYLPAFCQTVGCNEPLVILCKLLNLFIVPSMEVLRAEIQKLDEEHRMIKAKKKKRLMFLREMEINR